MNSRSIGNNLADINSIPDMYQPSFGLPPPLSTMTNSGTTTSQNRRQQPPPLPPRPQQQQQTSMNYTTPPYNNYNYPYNSYNSYNPYNNNNAYYNNNNYSSMYPSNNSFSQQAETTTRQAFQSVETIVRTFSSIAVMLDSTYQAVFSSFRALLGVSDHMGQLRSHFNNIYASMAVLRVVRFLLRKLKFLYTWVRRGPQTANSELLWDESVVTGELPTSNLINNLNNNNLNNNNLNHNNLNNNNNATWPVLVFFGVVMIGPWLLWKFLASFTKNKSNEHHQWSKRLINHYVAQADYDFEGSQGDELSFKRGSKLIVAPEEFQASSCKGWLMASIDGEKIGLIPSNYVRIVSKQATKQPINSTSHNSQPIKSNKLTYQPIKEKETGLNKLVDVEKPISHSGEQKMDESLDRSIISAQVKLGPDKEEKKDNKSDIEDNNIKA